MSFLGYTQAAGNGVSSLSPDLPPLNTDNLLIAWINVSRLGGDPTSPVCTPPSGWTLIIDNGSSGFGVFRGAYQRIGTGSTDPVPFSFDASVRGNIVVTLDDEIDSTTSIDDSSFRNDTVFTNPHLAASVTTTRANVTLRAMWASGDTGIYFNDSSDLPNTRVSLAGTTGSAERPTLIADAVQAVAGASGTKSANTNSNSFCQAILVAIRPFPGPSIPGLTFPVGGESITKGTTVPATWTPATSPTAGQGTLKYEPSYSSNSGSTWINLIGGDGLSAAAAITAAWNTTGLTVASTYLFRVRSYDPAVTLYSGYSVSAAFSIINEVAPAAPIGLAPNGGVQDKSASVRLSWQETDDGGNPQTAFTVLWSRDNFASHTATITTATANKYTDVSFAAETDGALISWKVKRQGLTLYSAYPSAASFTVASKPSAPNITAPVSASPPTEPNPDIVFTGSSFTKRRLRVVTTADGSEVHNSGFVASLALSFVSPYAFANGVAYAVYLALENQYGLQSTEDTETFTPAYTGPAAPTIEVTAADEPGYNQIIITNSDAVDRNEIWAYEGDSTPSEAIQTEDDLDITTEDGMVVFSETGPGAITTALRIARNVAQDGTFLDNQAKSGITRNYFARAIKVVGGADLYTDSASASAQITLGSLHIHAVTKTSGTTNALGNPVVLLNQDGERRSLAHQSQQHKLAGRSKPQTLYGLITSEQQSRRVIIPFTETSKLKELRAVKAARTIVCVRDRAGNKMFGKVGHLHVQDNVTYHQVTISIEGSSYTEAV